MRHQSIPAVDTLNKLLDKDLGQTRSLLRTKNNSSHRSLNNTHSSSTISLLDSNVSYFPPSKSRPFIMMGSKQIIELEKSGELGYDAMNNKMKMASSSSIPLLPEQEDIGMVETSIHPKVPLLNQPIGKHQAIVVKDKGGFKNRVLTAPTFEVADMPSYMIEAGPELDQKILTPSQRRECFEFTRRKDYANKYFRNAIQDRERIERTLESIDYQRGVPALLSANDITSEIYGSKAGEKLAKEERQSIIALERRASLANKQGTMKTQGNILVPDSINDRLSIQKSYQSKGGVAKGLSFDETHNRIFNRRMKKPRNPMRTQLIRDNDLSGKDYNIVTHAVITECPSMTMLRNHDKRLDHPSQASLEDSRNLQGALKYA